MKLILKFTLALLLCAPAWGAATFDTPVSLTDVSCAGNCNELGNFTIVTGSNRKLKLMVTARWSTSNDGAGLDCTVGGESATFVERGTSTGGNLSTNHIQFEILEATLDTIGTGSKAVVCSDAVVTDLRSVIVTLQMLHGVVQTAPQAQNGEHGTGVTTLSLDLTGVTAGAVVCWGLGHEADPGTESPAGSIDVDNIDGRYHESLCAMEATGGTVAVDPSWGNSVNSKGVATADAPAPPEETCTILVCGICTN